jgi:hypothetical protein
MARWKWKNSKSALNFPLFSTILQNSCTGFEIKNLKMVLNHFGINKKFPVNSYPANVEYRVSS